MLVSKRNVFKGKLLALSVEKRKLPNGYVAHLEVVKHPGAVLIVPILPGSKIVLIKQYRPVIKSYIWELPAGTLKSRERPLACAKRELLEEVGYKARSWRRVGAIYPAPGYATEKIIIYEAKSLVKTRSDIQEDEIIAIRIFSRKEIKKFLKSGKIVDSKTISALGVLGMI